MDVELASPRPPNGTLETDLLALAGDMCCEGGGAEGIEGENNALTDFMGELEGKAKTLLEMWCEGIVGLLLRVSGP